MSKLRLLSFVAFAFTFSACYESPKSGVSRDPVAPERDARVAPTATAALPSNGNSKKMNEVTVTESGFFQSLPSGFLRPMNSVESRLLKEYGSVFVAVGVKVPIKIVFKDQSEVSAFQSSVEIASDNLGGTQIELQSAALADLKKAIAEAQTRGLSITPRGGDSARRSYDETVDLWKSRVDPALKHWVGKGRMSQIDADRIAAMSPFEQVPEVLKLEETGIYFAKDLSKSIVYSVAPPGTSQHLSMLALDVSEHETSEVRQILARHKWFQTVVSDLPHFTYLGTAESSLESRGLKKITSGGRVFWIPKI